MTYKKDSAQQDEERNFQRAAKPILTEYEKMQEALPIFGSNRNLGNGGSLLLSALPPSARPSTLEAPALAMDVAGMSDRSPFVSARRASTRPVDAEAAVVDVARHGGTKVVPFLAAMQAHTHRPTHGAWFHAQLKTRDPAVRDVVSLAVLLIAEGRLQRPGSYDLRHLLAWVTPGSGSRPGHKKPEEGGSQSKPVVIQQ
jgi:hypothetical protein